MAKIVERIKIQDNIYNLQDQDTRNITLQMYNRNTFVINNDKNLLDWANADENNDYTSVYINAGTYILPTGGINLTKAGTKIIQASPNSKLVFSNLTNTNGNYAAALYYETRPTDNKYCMYDVKIECVGSNATSTNIYPVGFYNCYCLNNCSAYVRASGTKDYQAAYAFYNCENLIFCFGASSGVNNGNAYTYASCNKLTNCTADETEYPKLYDPKADIIPFASSYYLVNCVAKSYNGYELSRGYFACNYLTGCVAEVVQDQSSTITEISGYNRCSKLINCYAKITNNSGKSITDLGGFIRSTMITGSISEGSRFYKCSFINNNNSSDGYTESYSDNYIVSADGTSIGGRNSTGILSWNTDKWSGITDAPSEVRLEII